MLWTPIQNVLNISNYEYLYLFIKYIGSIYVGFVLYLSPCVHFVACPITKILTNISTGQYNLFWQFGM